MQTIALQAVPNQTVTCFVDGQQTKIELSTAYDGHLYANVYLNDLLLIGGVLCQNLTKIVRDAYLGLKGDFLFVDMQPTVDIPVPDAPVIYGAIAFSSAPASGDVITAVDSTNRIQTLGTGDGVATTFQIDNPYGTVEVYKTDWQGRQLQYSTARTNEALYSEAFDSSSWQKNQCSATRDVSIAPDGTLTADVITASAGATNTYVWQGGTADLAGETWTFSAYVKAGSIAADTLVVLWLRDGSGNNVAFSQFDITTGAFNAVGSGSWTVQDMGSGWFRWSVTGTFPAAAAVGWTVLVDPAGTPVSGETYYLWGAQLEQASAPTSYIPTTTAPVTVTDYTYTTNVQQSAAQPVLEEGMIDYTGLGDRYQLVFLSASEI